MKKLLLLIGIIPLMVFGQDNDVPKQVNDAFQKIFTDAEDVIWTEMNGEFEASFYVDEEYKLAMFSADGKWLKTSTSINVESASAEITKPIYKKYKGSVIDNIFLVETANKIKFYRIQADDGESIYKIKMSEVYEILESKKVSFSLTDEDEEEDDELE
ncbi:hypothetical protein [Marinifilum sp. D737]|uniref:hypothetical protein n=1 Tax=Marinifilum sp. D737 TaxID=2969628 RepID=UPI002273E286|nr:hypothetical protein [Marinifilum sp. D737]MCY1633533.1 hypothetical protein [Marinifilum sp. D737]